MAHAHTAISSPMPPGRLYICNLTKPTAPPGGSDVPTQVGGDIARSNHGSV